MSSIQKHSPSASTPTPDNPDAIVGHFGIWGTLKDPALEREYRLYHLEIDGRICAWICILIGILEVVLIIADILGQGFGAITESPNPVRMLWAIVTPGIA